MDSSSVTVREKLSKLRAKALARRERKDLRHMPNASDLAVAKEHAELVSIAQYEVINRMK